MKLLDIVVPDAINVDLEARSRDDVIAEIMQGLVEAGAVEASLRDELVAQIIERERKGSTGFGKGVAVPHVKHGSTDRMVAAIGICQRDEGIDFNSLDGNPVYSIFLLVSPAEHPEQHLDAMEAIFGNLSKDTFRSFLRQSRTVEDVRDLLAEADEKAAAR